jgi:CheY-like chemotaxis protein
MVKGTDIVKILRQQGCVATILINSANGNQRDIKEYIDAGANAYLSKDSSPAETPANDCAGYSLPQNRAWFMTTLFYLKPHNSLNAPAGMVDMLPVSVFSDNAEPRSLNMNM